MQDELDTDIKMMARIIAVIMILLYGFGFLCLKYEGTPPGPNTPVMPFVLEGAPFGTYEHITGLSFVTLMVGFGLSMVGAVLLFWWERTAAGILIAASIVQTFLQGMLLEGRLWLGMGPLFTFALPPLITAILLLIRIRLRNPLHAQELADGKAGTSSLAPK
jgi:hypothetical protein